MQRQSVFGRWLTTWTSVLVLICVTMDCKAQAPGKRPPNVIVILSDDQGSVDLNIYGSEDLFTPNLDALAHSGVHFSQFYAAAPVCSPSRTAVLTGRYPLRAGLPINAESRPEQFGKGQELPAEEVTIAEMLKERGYRTGHFGKWHLGTKTGPNEQGFDESFGFMGGVVDKWSHYNYGGQSWGSPPKRHDLYRNGQEVWESGVHTGDLIIREAIRFIEADSDKPFFMYLAFGNPHFPVQGYDKYLNQYAHLPEPRRSYAAALSTLDEQIGRLITRLDDLGLRDNTLILFQSDNGHSTEPAADYGGGSAGPYRGAKNSLFEGGIRVPAIVSMPGTIPQGEVRNQVAHGCDWLPTIAELTGSRLLNPDIDGKSLVPVLRSAIAPSPHGVVHWQTGRGADAQWAVRDGAWKLLGNPRDTSGKGSIPEGDALYLVNLDQDVSEMNNLAEEYPEIVERLKRLHDEWTAQIYPGEM